MKAALRDAKVAAAKKRGRERAEPKRTPWMGFFDLFRNLLGERASGPERKPRTRLIRQQARHRETERKATQRNHEARCDKRFYQQRHAAHSEHATRPDGMIRRLWKRSWIEAEAYAENARRAGRARK